MTCLDRVSFSYPGKEILRDFSLKIEPGGRIALMGPSGCGKTTLLRLLMGLEHPTAGRIIQPPRPAAVVFQEDRLLAHKTILQNAALAGDEERAAMLLKKIGLGAELHCFPAALSGGMRRRAAIARALAASAPLLILDEPFNGLDEKTKQSTAALILSEWKNPILAVTHLKEEAELLHAEIILMPKIPDAR